ncbi:MAG: hypothetical protein ACOH5I_22515 [Oligoflexus sp.]
MWKRSEFQNIKADIIASIKPLLAQPKDERLAHFLTQVTNLKDGTSPDTSMRAYIYAMFALNTHLQFGGLRSSQVKDLLNLTEAMLTLGGVKPRTSSLAYLYGEIHMVTSQLHVLGGEALLASWEQQIAIHLSGNQLQDHSDYQDLQAGMQALRLGFTGLAKEDFQRVWQNSQDPKLRSRAGIHLLRCMRLAHQLDEATALDQELRQSELTEKAILELDWEYVCRLLLEQQDPEPLFRLVRRGKPHYRPGYLLEAFFWARALPGMEWQARLPKLKTLRQKKEFDFQHYTIFLRSAQELEKAEDTEIPLQHRLQHAKKILSSVQDLQDIDKHLLVIAALLRWLIRSNYRRLARLLYAEYAAMSRRLSHTQTSDVLGIFTDIPNKAWLLSDVSRKSIRS